MTSSNDDDDPPEETFESLTASLEASKARIKEIQERYDLLIQVLLARGTGDLTQAAGELAGRTAFKEAPPIVANDIRYELTLRERVEQSVCKTPLSIQQIAEVLDESVGRVAAVIRILKGENVLSNAGTMEQPLWSMQVKNTVPTPVRAKHARK